MDRYVRGGGGGIEQRRRCCKADHLFRELMKTLYLETKVVRDRVPCKRRQLCNAPLPLFILRGEARATQAASTQDRGCPVDHQRGDLTLGPSRDQMPRTLPTKRGKFHLEKNMKRRSTPFKRMGSTHTHRYRVFQAREDGCWAAEVRFRMSMSIGRGDEANDFHQDTALIRSDVIVDAVPHG